MKKFNEKEFDEWADNFVIDSGNDGEDEYNIYLNSTLGYDELKEKIKELIEQQ